MRRQGETIKIEKEPRYNTIAKTCKEVIYESVKRGNNTSTKIEKDIGMDASVVSIYLKRLMLSGALARRKCAECGSDYIYY